MPDLIRHPAFFWIPAFAGMTIFGYLSTGAVLAGNLDLIEVSGSFLKVDRYMNNPRPLPGGYEVAGI